MSIHAVFHFNARLHILVLYTLYTLRHTHQGAAGSITGFYSELHRSN